MATTSAAHLNPVQLVDRLDELEPHVRRLVFDTIDACAPPEGIEEEADLVVRLAAVKNLKDLVEETVRLEVQELRRWQGMGWPLIADALGISRQGARQKYQHPADAALAEAEELHAAEVAVLKARLDAEIAQLKLEAVTRGLLPDSVEDDVIALRERYRTEHGSALLTRHMERWMGLQERAEKAYRETADDD